MTIHFRWFGESDPIPLAHVRQIPGTRGVVAALGEFLHQRFVGGAPRRTGLRARHLHFDTLRAFSHSGQFPLATFQKNKTGAKR